jgi:hypothetical protein
VDDITPLRQWRGEVAGKVHPALVPPLAPTVPPLALVDLTGKRLQVVDDGVPVPTPNPPSP